MSEDVTPALVIHGGAWNIPDSAVEASLQGIRQVLLPTWGALLGGAPALDAVERAVRAMEDNPVFNAGVGSRLNRSGRVQLDAGIMEGSSLRAGAVGALEKARHPISVARCVLDDGDHVLLVGEGARRFARERGAETCRTRDLLVGRELDRYLRIRGGDQSLVRTEFDDAVPGDTVGAVALDAQGHVAAATSTGGTQDKAEGRVGDSPLVGSGYYADDAAGAASATGWGEGIMRVVLAKTAIDHMARGSGAEEAGSRALSSLDRVGGRAGLALVDRYGAVAAVYTTPRMARGIATTGNGLWMGVNESLQRCTL